jgi:6,7-dimethyl-8-ribityllumazine synthase
MSNRDIDSSSENVLSDWARDAGTPAEPAEEVADEILSDEANDAPAWGTAGGTAHADPEELEEVVELEEAEMLSEPGEAVDAAEAEPGEELETPDEAVEAGGEDESAPFAVELSTEHAAGDLHIPDGYAVLEGAPEGGRRAVGIVVSRFNGKVTTRLLDRALEELAAAGVRQESITVMVVPGAFELPIAATALAKTRRFACIVALGCIIRGDTPHFDYVASEAASGLQLAALETGVPVTFGVLTLDRVEQAEPRVEKAAEAVRSALEMADLFAHLRAAASR